MAKFSFSLHMAKTLYRAYCKQAGGKSVITGATLPPFEETPEAVQRCWQAVATTAIAIITSTLNHVFLSGIPDPDHAPDSDPQPTTQG